LPIQSKLIKKYQEKVKNIVITHPLTTPHPHLHHLNCEHLKIFHKGHLDYLHDSHLHYQNDNGFKFSDKFKILIGTIEVHRLEVSKENPETKICQPMPHMIFIPEPIKYPSNFQHMTQYDDMFSHDPMDLAS
jgi:hypothetical protein